MGGEPTPVITLYNCPRHHHSVFMASPVNACVAHVGDLRWSALLEQPWSVFLQLRPAQVGQDSWWMEHAGRQSGRTAAQRGPGPLLKKLLHSGVLLSGPAGGGCDLLQLLRYSCRVLWWLSTGAGHTVKWGHVAGLIHRVGFGSLHSEF